MLNTGQNGHNASMCMYVCVYVCVCVCVVMLGIVACTDHAVQPLYAHQQGRWPDNTCVSTHGFIFHFLFYLIYFYFYIRGNVA